MKAWMWLAALLLPAIFVTKATIALWDIPDASGDLAKLDSERLRRQARALTHWDAFMADRRTVAQSPIFAPTVDGEDAGAILNVAIPWRPRLRATQTPAFRQAVAAFEKRAANPDTFESLGGAADLRARVRAWGDDFPAHVQDLPPLPSRTLFMHSLVMCRRWDLDRDTPRAFFEAKGDVERFLDEPMPDFEVLEDWAKIHLLQGLRDGQVTVASAEVRQLARLMVTTEEPFAVGTATNILGAALRAEQQVGPLDRAAVAEFSAANRYALAIAGLVAPGIPDDRLDVVLDPRAPGVCAAVAEILPYWHVLRYRLEPRWPDFYRRLDRLVAAPNDCVPSVWRDAWKAPAQSDSVQRLFSAFHQPDKTWSDRAATALGLQSNAVLANLAESYANQQIEPFERRYE